MDITATDTLNLTGVTDLSQIFYDCKSLIFNESINNWDVQNVRKLKLSFINTDNFNQSLSDWNTSSINDFYGMFWNASAFNQDISSWDFSSITGGGGLDVFMYLKNQNNYNPEYYDNLLIKWASDPSVGGLQPNIIGTIKMGTIKYTSNGAAARQSILDNNKAQTINDGGQI